MKNILILAYDFPPYDSIAAQRPASWLKYLPENDLSPTVITLHWDNKIKNTRDYIIPSFSKDYDQVENEFGKIVRVPFNPNLRDRLLHKYGFEKFSLVRKALTLYYSFARFFLLLADNTSAIYFSADKELGKRKYDFLIATGEPFILFRYANKLARKHGIPWVADYRDCWTNNANLPYWGKMNAFFAKHLFRRLEKRYVGSAKLITTPAPSYKTLLRQLFPYKKIEVIFNGSDIDCVEDSSQYQQRSDVFEIAYAGRFYEHQQLEVFLDGYLGFVSHNHIRRTRLVFYGLEFFPEDMERLIKFDQGLAKYIHTTPRIQYHELVPLLGRANLLLLLSKKGMDIIPAKLFDYLPLQRKIMLVCNDHGILERILDDCNAGFKIDTAKQVEDQLLVLYKEFEKTGQIDQRTTNYEKYTRQYQTKMLAEILKTL